MLDTEDLPRSAPDPAPASPLVRRIVRVHAGGRDLNDAGMRRRGGSEFPGTAVRSAQPGLRADRRTDALLTGARRFGPGAAQAAHGWTTASGASWTRPRSARPFPPGLSRADLAHAHLEAPSGAVRGRSRRVWSSRLPGTATRATAAGADRWGSPRACEMPVVRAWSMRPLPASLRGTASDRSAAPPGSSADTAPC